ncbi:cation:proton antiporter [Lactobacillus sp. LC28-10]|uniref:Cation:proton antiporter n=1 Tax=Secundilactobacillus angelensis TaxID=2722706 RepID=A0ABX1L1A2_9LACO|nr:cation:proton antiporter [Secundilactobacillus angelensis]NLR18848.1 cation:proton antiporter [Secundilactobacillus angelensis]
MNFIGTLCLLLVLTTFAGHFSNRMGIPSVIGQILVGIVVGPAMFNWVQPNQLLNVFSDIGVILLMFIGGLESNLALLRRFFKPAIVVALCGVIMPVALMGGTAMAFHFSAFEATYIGVIFSATSVSISVAVLREYHALDTSEGATILGAAVADDIVGVILLSVMISLMGTQGLKTSGQNTNIILILLEQMAFFGGTYLVVRWIAPYLMGISEKLLMNSSVTIMSMVICLGMAWVADAVGLSGAVGAFFAGIAVAHTPYREVVEAHTEPIGYAAFVPLFFVGIGLSMSFKYLGQSLGLIIVMTLLACLTKLLGCGLGARLTGFSWHSSYVVGTGMISRGEMGMITVQIGLQAGLLSNATYSKMVLVIILATIIAPFMLKQALKPNKQEPNPVSDKP